MAEQVLRASNSVNTIIGIMNQFHSFLDINYVQNFATTLNSKYNVLAGLQSPPTEPLLQYFGIGICGYQNLDDQQAALPYEPKATNMDLYGPIPVRCVLKADENSLIDRTKYRLRREVVIGTATYVLYYLKKIVFNPNQIVMKHRDVSGVETDYILDPNSFLTPTPTTPQIDGSTDTNTNRIVVRATGVCEVTGAEVNEVVDVLYQGDSRYKRISELGFYTGCDVFVNSSEVYVPSATSGNKEAAYVQLAKHRTSLGSDMSDIDSIMLPYVTFENSACIDL